MPDPASATGLNLTRPVEVRAPARPLSPLATPELTIVVPTFKEAENLPELLRRLEALRHAAGIDLELLIMDDNSADGSEQIVAAAGHPWATLIVRRNDRGLSHAVLDGLRRARAPRVVVMDADLSHPPERIPDMLTELDRGADFVVGSRYVRGGSTDAAWGLLRWANSKAATLMARPFTSIRDPMSGFFALRTADLARAADINPIGYKIGLEILVKCRFTRVVEVPIHFADRTRGQSKLNFREQARYARHVARLARWKLLGR